MKYHAGTPRAYFNILNDDTHIIGIPFIAVRDITPKIPSKIGALLELGNELKKQIKYLENAHKKILSEIAKENQLTMF